MTETARGAAARPAPAAEDAEARLAYWHREGFVRARHHADRFVAMVQGLGADQQSASVPGMAWSVAEVVAHVATVARRYTVDARRGIDPDEVTTFNAQDIAAIGTDVDALLEEISTQLAALDGIVDVVAPDQTFPFHGGQLITMAGGWANLVGELLAHGDDIARATGVEWRVDGADLEPLWRYTSAVLPAWLSDAGRAATDRWELDFGFVSGPVRFRFTGGGVAIDELGEWTPDAVLRGDAVEITLAVPYGRRKSEDPSVERFAARFVEL